jgi:hypothetical protein
VPGVLYFIPGQKQNVIWRSNKEIAATFAAFHFSRKMPDWFRVRTTGFRNSFVGIATGSD